VYVRERELVKGYRQRERKNVEKGRDGVMERERREKEMGEREREKVKGRDRREEGRDQRMGRGRG